MVEKRSGSEGDAGVEGGENAVKRPRIDEPAVKKPTFSLEALETAKKALQLQKELKEKLKNLPQVWICAPLCAVRMLRWSECHA